MARAWGREGHGRVGRKREALRLRDAEAVYSGELEVRSALKDVLNATRERRAKKLK